MEKEQDRQPDFVEDQVMREVAEVKAERVRKKKAQQEQDFIDWVVKHTPSL